MSEDNEDINAKIEAELYLTSAEGYDLNIAAELYYNIAEEAKNIATSDMTDSTHPEEQDSASNPPQTGGGRTLDGTYIPPTASSSSQPARQTPQRGMRTIKDLQSGGGGHGHGHDDGQKNSDDDNNDDDNQDFFAGGEKSGLAVQNPSQANPRDQINNILKRARQNIPRPGGEDESAASHFRGAGTTLGGDDVPSRTIPDPDANIPAPPPRARRELHLWRDGFSVDDGDLYRYDDPAHARTLEMINTGHAPLHILNVEHGQEVDVEVHPHKDENYTKPKRKYVPFSDSGNRLGSPTPGASLVVPLPSTSMTTTTTSASTPAGSAQPAIQVNSSAPTITLQIRLGDGSRLQSRFNTSHTIGDVYEFVTASSPASQTREFVLMTIFPSKELTDKTQALGDMSDFKRGGVVVQKWK